MFFSMTMKHINQTCNKTSLSEVINNKCGVNKHFPVLKLLKLKLLKLAPLGNANKY